MFFCRIIFSKYVPCATKTVSPSTDASIPACIVEKSCGTETTSEYMNEININI